MKKISFNLQFLKFLFWLGPMLVAAGISAGLVSGMWNSVPLLLIVAGVVIIGVWLVSLTRVNTDSKKSGFWAQRSTQVGANALIATLAVLAILGLVNFLAAQHVGRLDLTENQVFTLAPETQQLVRNLKQPVKVWVFVPEADRQDKELLQTYRRQSDRLSFEFVDPNSQPNLAQQLEVKQVGDVIVQMQPNGRKQFVQSVSLNNPDSLLNEGQRLSEVKLTSAIAQLESDRQIHVYFLQGHGERPLEAVQGAISEAVKTLAERSYVAKPLVLAETLQVPADADVLAIAGPQKALLESEVTALDAYLKQGGNLLLLIDPNIDPGLTTLLTSWGVELKNQVVIDISQKVQELGPIYALVTQYGNHPITKDFGTQLSFYPLARPIDIKPVPKVLATPLLFSSEKSWGETDIKKQPLKFDAATERRGPLLLGAALVRPTEASPPKKSSTSPIPQASGSPTPSISPSSAPSTSPTVSPSASPSPSLSPSASLSSPSPLSSPTSPSASPRPLPSPTAKPRNKESRLVIIGSSSFATDGLFNNNRALNGDVFLNSVRWLSQADQQTLSVRPKETKNRRINLTGQQATLVAWTSVGILPLLGFGTAFFIWWRRR